MSRTISMVVHRLEDGTPIWGDVPANVRSACSGCQAGNCKISHELDE